MHKQLEDYLATVSVRLESLPEERRREQLAELGAHLHALVESGLMLGETEEEAVAAALRQFGPAPRIGQELFRAWQREQRPHHDLWSATTLVPRALRGGFVGVMCGSCSALILATSCGNIAAGYWSAGECELAQLIQGALLLRLFVYPQRPGSRRALLGLSFLLAVPYVAFGLLNGMFIGPTDLGQAIRGTFEVLTNRLPTFGQEGAGRVIYASYHIFWDAAVFSLLNACWQPLWDKVAARRSPV